MEGDRYLSGDGVSSVDPEFGRTTTANGIAELRGGRLCLGFDVRYVIPDGNLLEEKFRRRLVNAGWDMELVRNSPGFRIDESDRNLNALLDGYARAVGSKSPRAQLISGGTYARCLPNAFGIGTKLNNTPPFELPSGHGGAHQPDELINIDSRIDAIAVIVRMMLSLDGYEGR